MKILNGAVILFLAFYVCRAQSGGLEAGELIDEDKDFVERRSENPIKSVNTELDSPGIFKRNVDHSAISSYLSRRKLRSVYLNPPSRRFKGRNTPSRRRRFRSGSNKRRYGPVGYGRRYGSARKGPSRKKLFRRKNTRRPSYRRRRFKKRKPVNPYGHGR